MSTADSHPLDALRIDAASPSPPFAQVIAAVTALRASGALAAGERLPPVRHLADVLDLAPNTVARAYRELEASGVIETRGRHGSFVTGTAASAEKAARAAAAAYAATVRALHLSPDAALGYVRDALGA